MYWKYQGAHRRSGVSLLLHGSAHCYAMEPLVRHSWAQAHSADGNGRTLHIYDLFRSLQNLYRLGRQVFILFSSIHGPAYSRSRCLAGMLNGNIGVMKSMLAELADETNIAQASALAPVMWSLGATIGRAFLIDVIFR